MAEPIGTLTMGAASVELAALDVAVESNGMHLNTALVKAFELGRTYERSLLVLEDMRAKSRIPIEEAVQHSPRCGCGACPQ